jgi:Tol biopolymer transport system component
LRSDRSGSPEIWVCDSDGSHPKQLTSFRGPLTNRPRWSPDGQKIAFHSDAKGNRDVYVVHADGGMPKQLTTNPSSDTNPDWSADGKWIYFQADRPGQSQIHQVWKVPVDGGERWSWNTVVVLRSNHPMASSSLPARGWPVENSDNRWH